MNLVRLDVHVIVAGPSTVAQAARQATATIPIVMAGVGEPEPSGRQHDGLASLLPELEAKPNNPLHDERDAKSAAKSVGLPLVIVRARTPEA